TMYFEPRTRAVSVGLELGAHDIGELHALAFGAADEALDAAERAEPVEESLQRAAVHVTRERVGGDRAYDGEQIPRAMLKLRYEHSLLGLKALQLGHLLCERSRRADVIRDVERQDHDAR